MSGLWQSQQWGGMFDSPPPGSMPRYGCVGGENGAAVFDKDDREKLRYVLARQWDARLRFWMWVMLNPSKAGECKNDGTVNRCRRFTQQLAGQEAGGLVVVNLFAIRATNFGCIRLSPDHYVGPSNDKWMRLILKSGRISRIIAAWGDDGHSTDRRKAVVRILREEARDKNIPLSQIGDCTQCGAPRHPSPRARRWLPDGSPLCPYRE